jgi:uncharacterized protein YggT (Ycf19 family)
MQDSTVAATEVREAEKLEAVKTHVHARSTARGSQYLDYAFFVLYALLGTRLVLGLIAANSSNAFVKFIAMITDPFYAPFKGIVASPVADGGITIAVPIMIAIVVYAMLHAGINAALRMVGTRKTSIAIAFIAASTLAGCSRKLNTAASTGTMAVQLTDAPFLVDSVARVDVFVVRVDARVSDADSATAARGLTDDSSSAGGWTTVATPNVLVNLLAYQNGVVLPLGNARISTGAYQGFRLVIDPSRSSLTLKNGMVLTSISSPNVSFPSAARSGIKINFTQPVMITEDDTTTVVADFIVSDSFVLRGNTIMQNGLLFKPVIRGTVRP